MNYKTQMEAAKKGIVTEQMKTVAQKENMDINLLMRYVAEGKIAIRQISITNRSVRKESVKVFVPKSM